MSVTIKDMSIDQIRNFINAVAEYEGGSHASWYIVRGHVDKTRFQEALRLEFGVDVELEAVEHIYVRNVPDGRKGVYYTVPAKQGRQGAYPITQVGAP